MLAICIATIFITLWKRDASKLAEIENDPRFQEVLGKNLLALDEEDYDEEAIPDKDDDDVHDDEEKPETSIDEPKVQVMSEAEPTDGVVELEAPLVKAE